MSWMLGLYPIVGLTMCGIVMVAFCTVAWDGLRNRRHNMQLFRQWQQSQRAMLDERAANAVESKSEQGAWSGWRSFQITRLVAETSDATSIYFEPVDRKPIASYRPGQYLTIRLALPNQSKPEVRCYSLSDAPLKNEYRITVKIKPMPSEAFPKSVSRFLNEGAMVGDVVELKRPAGDFCLDIENTAPVVLLAAGVGITPMFSMIQSLTKRLVKRQVVLCYGNQNSKAHLFRKEIEALERSVENFHVLNCYSEPLPEDKQQQNFQLPGYLSVDVLKNILPNQQFQFYLCGPPAFMDSLFHGLQDWGVPASRIHFEAFGPATVNSLKTDAPDFAAGVEKIGPRRAHVRFMQEGDEPIEGESELGTILEIAEELNVELQSGCRAGNCGTCTVKLLKGKVKYPDGITPTVEPGYCLACVASPVGKVEIKA